MATRYRGTQEEERALDAFVKLSRAANSVRCRIKPGLLDIGLTETQFGALECLLHLGPMCQKELGDKLLTTSGNITMVVDNLEKRGLVQRVRSTVDRRFIEVQLTSEGRELIAGFFPRHAAEIAAAFSTLTAQEQEQLARLCRKLGRGAEAP